MMVMMLSANRLLDPEIATYDVNDFFQAHDGTCDKYHM
jgi:hypothetical protein